MTERTRNKISRIETSLVILLLVSILAVNIYSSRSTWISEVTEIPSPPMGSPYETEKTVSYIISKVGSNYYAVNGTTGRTQFYGTNASTLLTSVILALSNAGGGDILIKRGDYPVSPQVVLKNYVNIRGEGVKTRLYLPNSQPLDASHYTILYGSDVHSFKISDLCLDGNRASNNWTGYSMNGDIFIIGDSYDIDIENCDIIEHSEYGVAITAYDGDNIYNVNTRFCRFVNGGMYNPIYYLSWSTGAAGTITGCTVEGNDVKGFSDIGIDFGNYGTGIVRYSSIINNKIHDGVNGYGSGGGTDTMFGIRTEGCQDCLIQGNEMWMVRHGIGSAATDIRNKIIGNTIRTSLGGTSEGNIVVYGNYTEVKFNTIYGAYNDWVPGINVKAAADYTTIQGNYIVKASTGTNFRGVNVNTPTIYTVVIGNRFVNCDADINDDTSVAKMRDNMGSNNSWITDV